MAEGTDTSATDAAADTKTGDAADATLGAAGEKALEEFKSRARQAERDLKAATAELDKVRKAAMTDQEKAVAEAEQRGRAGALLETGSRLVDAEIRIAATGRSVDVDALLEGLDRSKFLADGEPDAEAVKAWIDRVAPTATPATPPAGPLSAVDLGQGSPAPRADTGVEAFITELTNKVGGVRTS